MVLLIAGHVVEMGNAPGDIDLPRARVDELRPRLADGVPVLPELPPLQPAGVLRRRAYEPRAPAAAACGVPDVPQRDLRVCGPRRPHGVGVDFRRADAEGLGRGNVRHEDADSGGKEGDEDSCLHMVRGVSRKIFRKALYPDLLRLV